MGPGLHDVHQVAGGLLAKLLLVQHLEARRPQPAGVALQQLHTTQAGQGQGPVKVKVTAP